MYHRFVSLKPPPIRVKKVAEKIYCVLFTSYCEMSRTMLRFAEYYECANPRFRNRPFTLKEFKAWYRSIHGKFSYYSDWGGYNIDASVLKPFYEGKFKYITQRELQVLNAFANVEAYDFYIIGVIKDGREWGEELSHELSHAMFRVNETYRYRVTKIIKRCMPKLRSLNKYLRKGGYCRQVMIDEAAAYLATDAEWLRSEGVKIDHLKKEVAKREHLFKIHKPKNIHDVKSWKRKDKSC